jgi:hypothetical protein
LIQTEGELKGGLVQSQGVGKISFEKALLSAHTARAKERLRNGYVSKKERLCFGIVGGLQLLQQ